MHAFRTHKCADLCTKHIGQTVRLSGWLHRKREHANALFMDLRDHYGLTQLVIYPGADFYEQAKRCPSESVLRIEGEVLARLQDTVNPELFTGEIEVRVDKFYIESQAQSLPLPVFGEPDYPEDIRLTHRYLDLRREGLHKNIMLRSQIISAIRRHMLTRGFDEFQTPVLTASSPEGARDFLVPARLHPGKFYALPQAPQQFKQLIMIAGFDRYFQIAPCFRDEDARADRSPGEFYQLDIEMSFVTQEDVLNTIESVLVDLFEEFADGRRVESPFLRIPYKQALAKYGTDKPDLRIGFEICDVSEFFIGPGVEFKAFRTIVEKGGQVQAIPAPNTHDKPRRFFDRLNDWAVKEMQAPGMGYIRFEEEDGQLVGRGPIAKFFQQDVIVRMAKKAGIVAGDGVFFAAGKPVDAYKLAGAARQEVARQLDLIEKNVFKFCWIVDFPMYEWDEELKKVDFSHNPFSMPQGGLEALEAADTAEKQLALLAYQYDIVCNGIELSSGAIRNHKPDIMYKAFEIAGYTAQSVDRQFSGMINALRYGAPPHGGIAPGIDRIVMLLAGVDNIREVILFPMNQQAQDLMMQAPAEISPEQLKELHLKPLPLKSDL